MDAFYLNESALSDKGERGLFNCGSSAVVNYSVWIQNWSVLFQRWVRNICQHLKEFEDVAGALCCVPSLFPHCHGECSNPSHLFRWDNGYSSSFKTILYIVIAKAILSWAFQFQSQCPSFICISKTSGKHISATVRLIMASFKVFLMIQFEAVISRGRKLHLLGVFYFNFFFNIRSVAEYSISPFLIFQTCKIAAGRIGTYHSPKQEHCLWNKMMWLQFLWPPSFLRKFQAFGHCIN